MKINDVINLATELHQGQTRKNNNLPYIIHPVEVYKQLVKWGVEDEDVLAAGICHDLIEEVKPNQDVLNRIKNTISEKSLRLVGELTYLAEFAGIGGYYKNKADYILSFKDKSTDALIIKIADRLCNVLDFYCFGDKEYAIKYFDKAEPIFSLIYTDKTGDLPSDLKHNIWVSYCQTKELITPLWCKRCTEFF